MLETGLTYTSRLTVGNENTAIALGSGDMPVLATPAMMALMENAAMLAVASALEDGDTTVGGHIESSHLRPTPVGAEVSATATLEKVEGRKLYFKIIAHQGDVVIGEGTHLRFIVNREKFLAKF
jgi:predicted thioesterase